jgi:hypothetical protein
LKLKLQTIIEGLHSKNMYTTFDNNGDHYGKTGITQASIGNNFSSQILVSSSTVGQIIYALLTHMCIAKCVQ